MWYFFCFSFNSMDNSSKNNMVYFSLFEFSFVNFVIKQPILSTIYYYVNN